jgi:hypothetical protein
MSEIIYLLAFHPDYADSTETTNPRDTDSSEETLAEVA